MMSQDDFFSDSTVVELPIEDVGYKYDANYHVRVMVDANDVRLIVRLNRRLNRLMELELLMDIDDRNEFGNWFSIKDFKKLSTLRTLKKFVASVLSLIDFAVNNGATLFIRIDEGKAFDWGKTSEEYAKYRDVYPNEFYQRIADRGLCIDGQNVLDLGTGTGVLPRNMYRYGANWTGTDISPEQIEQAKRLSEDADMKIDFQTVPTEEIDFPKESYDVITACQCFWYFDHERVMPKLADILKPDGRLLILYMAWLPFEDKIAGKSEELVLKYSPNWTGAGETKHAIWIPNVTYEYFELEDHEEYDLKISFTKESWHGRMKASRGVGASLSEEELEKWDEEHRELLDEIAPEQFEVLHYAALAVLKKK